MTIGKISKQREKEAIERLAIGVRARQAPDPIGELQAENVQLHRALKNLVNAVARARRADDAVRRNGGSTADWDEHEDAHASLIIRENEARELLPVPAEKPCICFSCKDPIPNSEGNICAVCAHHAAQFD